MRDHGHPGCANTLEGASQGSATAAIVGDTIGRVVGGAFLSRFGISPEVSGAAGSIVGGVVGSIWGAVQGAHKKMPGEGESKAKTSQDANTSALEKNTAAIDKMRFKVLGGGSRASTEASLLEAEISIMRTMRTGLA